MGKRDPGAFEKKTRDYYPTIDPAAVEPLIPFIEYQTFAEPCAGDGDLVKLIEDVSTSTCLWATDLEPQNAWVGKRDATLLTETDLKRCDVIVSNPPFSWNLLKPLLDHLPTLKPTWLLLPADVIHNRRMAPYMERCHKVVSVGRLYWLPNKIKGVDNFVWLLFDYNTEVTQTQFYGR